MKFNDWTLVVIFTAIIFLGSVQEGMAKAISSPEQSGASIVSHTISPEQAAIFQQIEVLKAGEFTRASFARPMSQFGFALAVFCTVVAIVLARRRNSSHGDVGRAHLFAHLFRHTVPHRH